MGTAKWVGYSHLLSNGGVLLEEEVHIHIDVACLYTPGHPTHNLTKEDMGWYTVKSHNQFTLSNGVSPLMRARKYPAASSKSMLSLSFTFCSSSSRMSTYGGHAHMY